MSDTDAPLPPNDVPTSWDGVRDEIASVLVGEAEALLTGSAPAIQQFAAEVSTDLAMALSQGREDLVAEIRAQVRARGEALRLEGATRSWDALGRVVSGVMGVGFKLLAAAV